MLDVLETTTVLAKYPENGRINKPAITRPPTKPHFPIPVDSLEEYIMSRKANDWEVLRKEYMVCSFHLQYWYFRFVRYTLYYVFCISLCCKNEYFVRVSKIYDFC